MFKKFEMFEKLMATKTLQTLQAFQSRKTIVDPEGIVHIVKF
jgi:hypothetical protein